MALVVSSKPKNTADELSFSLSFSLRVSLDYISYAEIVMPAKVLPRYTSLDVHSLLSLYGYTLCIAMTMA